MLPLANPPEAGLLWVYIYIYICVYHHIMVIKEVTRVIFGICMIKTNDPSMFMEQ